MTTPISKKVCLLGDFAVGKTSLIRRYVYSRFEDRYISTIGVKVSRKMLQIPQVQGATNLSLLLWDLAGSEEFTQMRVTYMRGAAAGVLVCDLTRPETMESLYTYAQDLLSVEPNAHIIIAANKHDLTDLWRINPVQLDKVAKEFNTTTYLTSAKTGHSVETLFQHLGQMLIG